MKKYLILPLFLLAFLTPTSAHAAYTETEKVKILETPVNRTVLVERMDQEPKTAFYLFQKRTNTSERLLLHYGNGCEEDRMKIGDTVELIVSGSLNGYRDQLKTGQYYNCPIEWVEAVNQLLLVRYVYLSEVQAIVRDEGGAEYRIYYNDNCEGIRAFQGKNVYADMSGSTLEKNDKLILPTRKICPLEVVLPREPEAESSSLDLFAEKEVKGRVPSVVDRVRAIPGHDSAYLYWRSSSDDGSIDHYIVSTSKYPIDTKDLTVAQMPNQETTRRNRIKITGLESDTTYYFYVIAVDNDGNTSSDWSLVAKASTHSAIPEDRTVIYGPGSIDQ